jgi:hypothetical protein
MATTKTKNKREGVTIPKLLLYTLALVLWAIFCAFLVNNKLVHASVLYAIMYIPTSLLTLYVLWLYQRCRKDSIVAIIFNGACALLFTIATVFYIVLLLTFRIGS